MAANQIRIGDVISDSEMDQTAGHPKIGEVIPDSQFSDTPTIPKPKVGEIVPDAKFSVMGDMAKGLKRAAGVAVGTVNAPTAYVWGSQEAQHIDSEQYNKMPGWKQALVSTGGGLHSAYRSITKKDDWGTLYGDYRKRKTGKTIREETIEDLNPDIKTDSPNIYAAKMTTADMIAPESGGSLIENMMNVVSDPLISGGIVANAAKAKIPVGAKTLVKQSKTPAWDKVSSTVGKKERSLKGVGGKIQAILFDRFQPIKKVTPKTYQEARHYSAYKDLSQYKFQELADSFKPVREDSKIVTDYINAHRLMTRAERGIKNPKGVTLDEAKQSIAEMEKAYADAGKNVEVLRNSLKSFKDWTTKYIIEDGVESGMLSKNQAQQILSDNEFYATFDVLDHMASNIKDIPTLPSKEYFSVGSNQIIKKMKGTEKQIDDPIEATIRKFSQAQGVYARNKVASQFVDEANDLVRPVADNAKQFKQMENQGLNPVLDKTWNKKEFDIVTRFRDGKPEKYITNKELADTLKQLTPRQAPKVIRAVNDLFRKSATSAYLPFTLSNAMRDGLMAYTTAPVYKATRPDKFAKDWGKGFWEGVKHEFLGSSDLTKEYIKNGGGFGYVGTIRSSKTAKNQLLTPELRGKEIAKELGRKGVTVVSSPFKLIEKISSSIELAPRLGTYKRGLQEGMANKNAVTMARESTIDFNRGGTLTKVANQYIPFLNARIQGRVTLASALKNNPKQTLSKAFVSTVLPGATAYAYNKTYHPDLYEDIPEYVKQKYFTIITGAEEDKSGKMVPKYVVIAKGDLGEMGWNAIEFGLEQQWAKDKTSVQEFAVNMLSDLSPIEFAREGKSSLTKTIGSVSPPLVRGVLEAATNLNFYRGTEIDPHYDSKNKPPELRYRDSTPETYKWLGKKIGVSPNHLQNFASNILAGYGREGLDPESMMRGLKGRIVKAQGGNIEQKAWTAIKGIEQGYSYTRAAAQELINEGNRSEGVKLLREWNSSLQKQRAVYNTEFAKHQQVKDKGGILKSYRFTPEKIIGLIKKQHDKRHSLEKKLSIR